MKKIAGVSQLLLHPVCDKFFKFKYLKKYSLIKTMQLGKGGVFVFFFFFLRLFYLFCDTSPDLDKRQSLKTISGNSVLLSIKHLFSVTFKSIWSLSQFRWVSYPCVILQIIYRSFGQYWFSGLCKSFQCLHISLYIIIPHISQEYTDHIRKTFNYWEAFNLNVMGTSVYFLI